jgi:arylsulfatase A-like enzyme
LENKILNIHSDLKAREGLAAPLTAGEAAERQQLIDLYDASILYSDQELLKPLIAYLHASRRYADALLVVLGDHGEEFYDHGRWSHGHSLYQELTRIPLVVKLPGQDRGEVCDQLASICDVFALVRGEVGLGERNSPLLGETNVSGRILELSLPVYTQPYRHWGKVSFVESGYQYIHNFQPEAVQGVPPPDPAVESDEWFTVPPSPVISGVPFSPSPVFISRYRKMLGDYIRRLKSLKKNIGSLDPKLIENLKALGYLNN